MAQLPNEMYPYWIIFFFDNRTTFIASTVV